MMDAATLYMIVTMPNGEQSTSTMGYPTLEACEAQAELLQTVEPLDRQSPVTSYHCKGHNPFAFIAGYGRSRRYVEFPSRQGCTAVQWITYLHDRGPGKFGYCFEDPGQGPPCRTCSTRSGNREYRRHSDADDPKPAVRFPTRPFAPPVVFSKSIGGTQSNLSPTLVEYPRRRLASSTRAIATTASLSEDKAGRYDAPSAADPSPFTLQGPLAEQVGCTPSNRTWPCSCSCRCGAGGS